MWFKHRAWIPIAWLLSLANVGAVWFAAVPAEPWHATLHAGLAVLFALGAQRLTVRRRAQLGDHPSGVSDDRMKRFEQAVDAIAVEVERIGEGQRFVTKKLAERADEPDRSAQSPRSPAAPASQARLPDDDR